MENVRVVKNGDKTLYKVFFPKVKVGGQEHSCLLIEAASHLEAWLNSYPLRHDRTAPLFPTFDKMREKRHLSPNGFRDQFRKAIRKSKLKKKTYPHLSRHSRATFLLKKGWSEPMINKYIGWVPQSTMIGRYGHLADQDVDNKIYEMHGMKPEEPEDMGALIEATAGEMGISTPPFPQIEIASAEDLLSRPELTKRIDELIEARVEQKYGNWATQVETGKLSKAMEERIERIRIGIKKVMREIDPNAIVESIEVSFPEFSETKEQK